MRRLAIITALAVLTAACGSAAETSLSTTTSSAESTTTSSAESTSTTQSSGGVTPDFARSSASRHQPTAPSDDIAMLAAGNGAFAADLYEILVRDGGNVAFSPLSVRMALAMTYAGADGTTAVQMADALRLTLFNGRLAEAYNTLDQLLESRSAVFPSGPDGTARSVELSIANALWAQQAFTFEQSFLDVLSAEYGAGVNLVDFAAAVDQARAAINDWVAAETNDRITDLIGEGVLSDATRLVLTNAVYLDATWSTPFNPDRTAVGGFTRRDGANVDAEMMRGTFGLPYAEGEGWQAVELPYSGEELAMLIIVPDVGEFDAVEGRIGDLLDMTLDPAQVALGLPRFEFRTQTGLVGPLRELGMNDAFDAGLADFSRMTGARDLFIGDVVHETFVSVDEEGTEAAAATAVVMDLRAAPAEPVVLEADRPFIFALRDRSTGAVLFLGRVMDPTS